MASAEELGLLFRIRADSAQAEANLKKFANSILEDAHKIGEEGLQSFGKLGNAMTALEGPAAIAALAIGGVVAVSVELTHKLFELTEQSAEYGNSIFEASEKTGLSAQTLSALKAQADQVGIGFENVQRGLTKFSLLMGDAAKGSDKAQEKLAALHVTSKDLDEGFGQVIKRIAELKPGIEQNTAAADAFGRKFGAQLLPFIHQFEGDLPGLIEKMKKLGLVMSGDDAKASHEFEVQMKALGQQLDAAKRIIGQELMPTFMSMAREITTWLTNNKGEVKTWGDAAVKAFKLVGNAMSELVNDWQMLKQADEWTEHSGLLDPEWYARWQARNKQLEDEKKVIYQQGQEIWDSKAPATPEHHVDGFQKLLNRKAPSSEGDYTSNFDEGKKTKEKDVFKLSAQGKAFVDVANKLGISPIDLATIVGFESAGTYSTSITNASGHFGLIQFDADAAKASGAVKGQGFKEQLDAVGRYLEQRFAKVGKTTVDATLLDLYRTVLGGNPNASLTGTDANGTSPMSGVRRMLQTNRPAALNKFFGGSESNIPGSDWQSQYGQFANAGDKEQEEAKKKADADFKLAQENEKRKYELYKASNESQIQLAQYLYDKQLELNDPSAALKSAQQIHDLKMDNYRGEIAELTREVLDAKAGSKEELEAIQKLNLAEIEYGKKALEVEEDLAKNRRAIWQKLYDDAVKMAGDALDRIESQTDDIKENRLAGYGDQLLGAIGRGRDHQDQLANRTSPQKQLADDLDNLKKKMESLVGMKNVLATFGSMAVEVFQNMASAVGSAVEQWALYGGSVGQALKKALAAELAHIAGIATINALYATALGFMRLAEWDFSGATNAFISAGIWAAVAGGSALGARALSKGNAAQGAFNQSTTGTNSSNSDPSNPNNRFTSPFAGYTNGASANGQRVVDQKIMQVLGATHDAITTFNDKFGTASPGDVVRAGAGDASREIHAAHTSAMEDNPSATRQTLGAMGLVR